MAWVLDLLFRRPSTVDGHKIYYDREWEEPCPVHKCTTYQTDDPYVAYCPECQRLLDHYL